MTKTARIIALAALAGCTGGKTGTVQIAGWGEEDALTGYPTSDLSFIDGWTLTLQHSITTFSGFELADQNTEEVVAQDTTVYAADWTKTTDPAPVTTLDVPDGRYKFSFSFVPATADATKVSDVDSTILQAMVDNGWNTYIEGTATKGSTTVTFKWGMANAASYTNCVNGLDDSDGVAVAAGETTDATMYVHQDHTYWDKLGTEEANLRFDAPASWADSSGEVHLDDLAGTGLAPVRDPDGNPILDENDDPLSYDDAGLGLATLKDFVVYSTAQQGHLNGEGLCTVTDLAP
jgi:hypothetical protein